MTLSKVQAMNLLRRKCGFREGGVQTFRAELLCDGVDGPIEFGSFETEPGRATEDLYLEVAEHLFCFPGLIARGFRMRRTEPKIGDWLIPATDWLECVEYIGPQLHRMQQGQVV
jgi:hypothetical protein